MVIKSLNILILSFAFLLNGCANTISGSNNNCKDIHISDVNNLEIVDTKMSNPDGIFTTNEEYIISIKTKTCNKWRTIPETSTDYLWNKDSDITKKFQNAVKRVASIEQSIRDKFNLGKRSKVLMEKAQGWTKSLDEYCKNSALISCDGPNLDCWTFMGDTYCFSK